MRELDKETVMKQCQEVRVTNLGGKKGWHLIWGEGLRAGVGGRKAI